MSQEVSHLYLDLAGLDVSYVPGVINVWPGST